MPTKDCSDVLVKTISIPMRDNLSLTADLFIKLSKSSFPVLLLRTPYSRQDAINLIDPLKLARSGWAIVIQNVRGRLDSEGAFSPFMQEKDDGADTLDWISKQPWCNGKIAMSGTSYVGFVQWSCAQANTPHLKAISPQITASNILEHWLYEDGVFRQAFLQSWGLSFAYTTENNDHNFMFINQHTRNLSNLYNTSPQDSPLKELFKPYNQWLDKNNDSLWKNLPNTKKNPPNIPAFHLAGWFDIFCEGSIEDYVSLSNNLPQGYAKNSQRLVVGPWTHNELFSQFAGEVDFSLNANGHVYEIMQEIHAWLYDALEEKPVKNGAKIFIMGKNEWHEFSTWPPTEISYCTMFLQRSSDKSPFDMTLQNSINSNFFETFCFDSCDLPNIKGGRTLDPTITGKAGSFNQSHLIGRKDTILFYSDALINDFTIVGQVFIQLNIRSAAKNAIFYSSLLCMCEDSHIINFVSSVHSIELEPNKINKLNFKIGSTAFMVSKNQRICLLISSSNFPHTDFLRSSKGTIIKYEIISNSENPSFISIPTLGSQ